MTIGVWQPSTLYAPGSVVRRSSSVVPGNVAIVNPSFDDGLTGWTAGGTAVLSVTGGFTGANCVSIAGGAGAVEFTTPIAVEPGQSITAQCQIRAFDGSFGNLGDINIVWRDADGVLISEDQGNVIQQGNGSAYRTSSVTAVAPAGAALVVLRADASPAGGGTVLIDSFSWNHVAPGGPDNLVFKAVQPVTGQSGVSEPIWPTANGEGVTDNQVVWQAISGVQIVWIASPILKSGATEPTWPTDPDSVVLDNTVAWRAVSRRVTDENCPNTKVVLIGASKVFAVNEDIVSFSATVNPLDWTTDSDAGYLPTGLQQYGANPMSALGLYRGNLVAWNSQGMQIWQIDEDPQRMQLLDALPIGSTFPKAVSPVQNDLFFLTQLGVRSLGIAGGSVSLQAGDVGMPIDPLIREAIVEAAASAPFAISTYYPAQGQYFLTFSGGPG